MGSGGGLLDTRNSTVESSEVGAVSSVGLIGEGLEEKPGWEGLKRQVKGLGLSFSRNREPLVISELVSDLINRIL